MGSRGRPPSAQRDIGDALAGEALRQRLGRLPVRDALPSAGLTVDQQDGALVAWSGAKIFEDVRLEVLDRVVDLVRRSL